MVNDYKFVAYLAFLHLCQWCRVLLMMINDHCDNLQHILLYTCEYTYDIDILLMA